jgi:type II secretory pathway component GspD/PulD (secretin)
VNWPKLGSLVLALGLCAFATAQERDVNVAYREADIRTVLQQVGQVSGSPIVIQRGVEGRVTFQPSGPLTPAEFRRAILSHLADLGYEITERNGVLLIGPIKL